MNHIVNYNLHTHTYRCNHASGTDEEYVLKAIEKGIKVLGFSDHAPFKDIHHYGMRMDYEELDGYIKSITSLKEKYKDQIEIHIGLEIEYDKKYLSYYRELLNNGIEYLILGQHCYYENGEVRYWMKHIDDFDGVKKYCSSIVEAMKTGLFLYVCHPDFSASNIKDPKILEYIGKVLGEASAKYDVPLEVNCGGILGNNYNSIINGTQCYPNHYTFSEISKYKAKIVIGMDAHSPEAILNIPSNFLKRFVDKHNLNLLKEIKIK